ncbi:hypothetical protein [Pseudomonas sp. TWP3-2]|uniref:hypothetical protein n=1 Tax=Pseudomonas sp. TWP3-2 TaxID=2804574 RepID=UPI003CF4EC6A
MSVFEYKQLKGMRLQFVSGELKDYPDEPAIGYEMTFHAFVDFTYLREAANDLIPGYFDSGVNSIRVPMTGLGVYGTYADVTGSIDSAAALFNLITNPLHYNAGWFDSWPFELHVSKPQFGLLQNPLVITARRRYKFPLLDGQSKSPPITIKDLPTILFEWALTLLEAHDDSAKNAPFERGTLGYMGEDLVPVGDTRMREGTLYINPVGLQFGDITPQQILAAAKP